MTNLSLKEQIEEANKRSGMERQRMFAKKSVVTQTADQIIENLCAAAQDVLEAYYKELGFNALASAMRNLQGAVRIAGKRVR